MRRARLLATALVGGPGSPRPASGRPAGSGARSRRVALTGLLVVLAYLAGALASGVLSPWARRPLLDGLAPRPPYRWVKPPAELTAGNKAPSSGHFEMKLDADGSQVGAFSTQDTQVTLIFGKGAVAPSPGQSKLAVDVTPLDPATLAAPPGDLTVAGNAYRLEPRYLPAKRTIGRVDGELSVGLVYPLLGTSAATPAHVLLHSADGRAWTRLQSVDVPSTHQANGQLTEPGYLMVASTSAGAGENLADRAKRQAPLAAGIVLLLLSAVLFFRRRAAYQRLESEDGDEDDTDEEGSEPGEDGGALGSADEEKGQ